MNRRLLVAALALFVVAVSGCPSCAPDLVGQGIARLTVRNVGAMVTAVNRDQACGFASPDVIAAGKITGDIGTLGSLTLTVDNCVIDFGKGADVSSTCGNVTTSASGKVTISGKKTIQGILTGDAANPVVPASDQSATIEITNATFADWKVSTAGSLDTLTQVKGSLKATVKPRLAVAASNGACAIATPNAEFLDVAYAASTIHLTSADNDFDADVAASKFTADVGKAGGKENAIAGSMTVFGSAIDVAGDGKLDPAYDAKLFTDSYACLDDLATPESYSCLDLTPTLADGATRLSVKMLATIASLVDADTVCGFGAAAVQGAPTFSAAPGGAGDMTLTVNGCALTFPAGTVLPADCNGDATTIEGSVTVSGTKVISGRLTGNAAQPVVPITDQPAAIALTVTVDGFRVAGADGTALLADAGTLAGTVRPKTFVGASTGVCSVSSSNASFTGVTWGPGGDFRIISHQGTFAIVVGAMSVDATAGTVGADANKLTGTITIGEAGTPQAVPSDGAGLDPAFDQVKVDASFSCNPELAQPLSDDCTSSLTGQLAGGAAGLTMRTLGTLAGIVDGDTTCGFSSPGVAGLPVFAGGNVGDDDVTATFDLGAAGCTLALPAGFTLPPDCNGDATAVSGTVTVHGTKSVTGFRTGDPLAPIVPTHAQPAQLDLTIDFGADTVVTPAGATASLTVHGGTLAGTLAPRVALDQTTGACSISTPNATFSGVTWTNADATLDNGGSLFDLHLDTSALTAQAGSDGTNTNQLAGDITVDGNALTLPAGPLDPAFDPATFDGTYLCGAPPPLLVPDAACSFRRVLAQAAAGLLVKAAGTAAGVLDANPVCGFSDTTPDTAPAVVQGAGGAPSTLTLTADGACQSGFGSDTALGPNCVGTQTHASGAFTTTTATKVISGLFTGAAAAPVVPVTRDGAVVTMNTTTFTGWHVFDQPAAGPVTSSVTLNGTATIAVHPIAGKSQAASDQIGNGVTVFSNRTGIAAFVDKSTPGMDAPGITMAAGTMTMVLGTKTFNVALANVAITAFSGDWNGTGALALGPGSNDVSGTLDVDGETVALPFNTTLDPTFVETDFTATYSCNPDLNGDVVPPN